jgi:hypothetical protein
VYLRGIVERKIINLIMANIVAIPTAWIVIIGMYLMFSNHWNDYNFPILIQHILMNVPIITLCVLWVYHNKFYFQK